MTAEPGQGALRRSRGSFEVPVVGQRMEPTLRDGDVVRVNADHGYSLGEIVVVRDGEELLVHRVIRASESLGTEGLVTAGDAALERDPESEGRFVVGVVTAMRTEKGATSLEPGLGLVNRVTALLLRASTPRRGWRWLFWPLRRLWIAWRAPSR